MGKRSERRAPVRNVTDPTERGREGAGSDRSRKPGKRWPLFLLLFSVLVTAGAIALISPIFTEIGVAASAAIIIPLVAFSLIPLLLLRVTGGADRRR